MAVAMKVGGYGLGIPLIIIMLTWSFRYGLLMMEYDAWDGKEAPVLEVEMLNPLEQAKSGILLFITGVFFAIYYAAQYWSKITGKGSGAFVGPRGGWPAARHSGCAGCEGPRVAGARSRDWFHLIRWMKTDYLFVLAWHPHLLALRLHPARHTARRSRAAVLRRGCLMFGWLAVQALLGGAIRERRISDPDDSPVERFEKALRGGHRASSASARSTASTASGAAARRRTRGRRSCVKRKTAATPSAELRWMLDADRAVGGAPPAESGGAGARAAADRDFPLRRGDHGDARAAGRRP